MALSSNTLIHFTTTKEALKGILEDNFKVKYCREKIKFFDIESTLHIPMVSFCDIPLSQIKNHIASYGHYGIGLSREWALEKLLNPVLYIQGSSALAKTYEDLLRLINKQNGAGTAENNSKILVKDLARYIKNYEAPLNRKDSTIDKYRFSDEREWRYVPSHDEEFQMLYTDKEFQKITKTKANESLASLRLEFKPEHIKYIIIKNDDEISEFINHLRYVKGKNYSFDDVERLTTRILTSEQIHSDI